MTEMVDIFYDFDEIQAVGNCLELAAEFGLEPVRGKNGFNIPWRPGSDSGALSVNKDGFHDFVANDSGGVIEFVRRVKFSGNIADRSDRLQETQAWLGQRLHLSPKLTASEGGSHRIEQLADDGFQRICRYDYQDRDGSLRFYVERWQHPVSGKKEFVQRAPNGCCSIKGIEPVLYRLPEWCNGRGVCLCEGEKDADTLRRLGLPATTNNSGCGNWNPEFTAALAGKDVIIFVDNDEPGYRRETFLLWELRETVSSLKSIRFPDEAAGFDVTDFVNKYSAETLFDRIKSTPAVDLKAVRPPEEDFLAVEAAKKANRFDFCNFFDGRNEDGNRVVKPRQINDMVEELFRRFVGFPRKVGETLFDHDRDNRRIVLLDSADELFAWVQRKSKKLVKWKSGDGFVTKKEFFAAVVQAAVRYEEIIKAPVWPLRNDVYCEFPPLPKPSPDHEFLRELAGFFCPANPEYRVLLESLFCAPFYFEFNIPRPCWIIDSVDGASSGKTTLAEIVARLTGTEAIRTGPKELNDRAEDVLKRIVSPSGRQKRIFLLDNVTEQFRCSQFADMVTAGSISGRPPYGRGEEARPNNLTYIITANSASMDNDIAQRSYFVILRKPERYDTAWKARLLDFVERHRLQIAADIIDVIAASPPLDMIPQTRFPEFEARIVQGCCRGDGELYNRVIRQIQLDRDNANSDAELAQRIEDEFRRQLVQANLPPDDRYFIRSEVAERWIIRAMPVNVKVRNPAGILRDLARQGFCKAIDGRTQRIRNDSRRGFLWNRDEMKAVKVVGLIRGNEIGIVM